MSLYTKIEDIQKLNEAWKRVRKNKPAAGVDNVTWEMFDEISHEEIKSLNRELRENTYEPLPVKMVKLFKGEKVREIALYSMRDKVVQQSISSELGRIYDNEFSRCAFAYRPNKSALEAIALIDDTVRKEEYEYALILDIHHFFDEINHDLLRRILASRIMEEDTLDLIMRSCTNEHISEDGEILEKTVGVYQGSAIAPVLSNVYLMDFDRTMENMAAFYIRYSDDMVILTRDKETATEICTKVNVLLQEKSLRMNEKKTIICRIEDGFNFLGYSFNKKGKFIPEKAIDNLNERLETMWLTDQRLEFSEKLKKGSEILDGWEQYFREERTIASIYEFAIVIYMVCRKDVSLEKLVGWRKSQHNIDYEICSYLTNYWNKLDLPEMELFEYEDYYQVSQEDTNVAIKDVTREELVSNYKSLMINESKETMENIMQTYSDEGCFNKASRFMELLQRLEERREHSRRHVLQLDQHGEENAAITKVELDGIHLQKYMEYFIGREDAYCEESLDRNGRRVCEMVSEPLTEDVIRKNLCGKKTVGTYVQRSNGTAKFLVIDVDISKKILLEKDEITIRQIYMQKAAELTSQIKIELRHMGIEGYLEESGYRGYHVWVLFSEWIPVRYINLLEDILDGRMENEEDGLTVEYFPNKSHFKKGNLGQAIKLPYGYHTKSMKQSHFLNNDFSAVTDLNGYLSDLALIDLTTLKKVISRYGKSEQNLSANQISAEVDADLSEFGQLPDNIRIVLEGCNLMRYLCQKARKTGYLSHFERLTLLYVFGHMGDEGVMFLHKVMEFTLNYRYQITQKFINKVPEKPISCLKLRDQYQKVTAEYGCNCNFRKIKNCYPSPVLHAIKDGTDPEHQVTIPTSRTLTKEKETKICEELNINKKAETIAAKILELKKQKRGIDKNITKLENELAEIFREAKIDSLELSFGLLVRRKTENGYEWVVEI